MHLTDLSHDRRQFLRLTVCLSTGMLLSGCGSAGDASSSVGTSAAAAEPTPVATVVAETLAAEESHPLNLALNLAYLGAQYYGHAARGGGLPEALTSGIGRAGVASGARKADFSDASVANYATELANDKQAHVVALRNQIGTSAAAQPAIDLSAAATGAFSIAAQGAGIVAPGTAFDPYSSDQTFLLGAFFIENAVAAAYRTILLEDGEAAGAAVVGNNLADSIYHGGLIRSLLDDKSTVDPSLITTLENASALFAGFDGTNVGDQTIVGASGISSNILDADGIPIPFTRANAQILKALYLSSSGIGGFLPAGANGIPG